MTKSLSEGLQNLDLVSGLWGASRDEKTRWEEDRGSLFL